MSSSTGDTSKKMPWFRSFNAKMNNVSRRKFAEDKAKVRENDKKPVKTDK